MYAVRLTSKPHDGDRDFLRIGTGPWDSQGRPSWVDIDQLYSVHVDGMRREASALDLERVRPQSRTRFTGDTAGPSVTEHDGSWWAIPDSNR